MSKIDDLITELSNIPVPFSEFCELEIVLMKTLMYLKEQEIEAAQNQRKGK